MWRLKEERVSAAFMAKVGQTRFAKHLHKE